jgi:hypothetical protein
VLAKSSGQKDVDLALEAVTFCAALMKIVWASVVTLYFLEEPKGPDNLVRPISSGEDLPKNRSVAWAIQTALLLIITIIFAMVLGQPLFKESVYPVLVALGSLAGVGTVLFKVAQSVIKQTGATNPNKSSDP